jgi:SAM-dependent methyltransferase
MAANPYKHPARYTPSIVHVAAEVLHAAQREEAILDRLGEINEGLDPAELEIRTWAILDPMAGVGGVHELMDLGDSFDTLGIEIEQEWADAHPRTLQGDATNLERIPDGVFDAIFVSPVYGNRFSDSHKAKDGSRRTSYTHNIRALTGDPDRELAVGNAGSMYAWQEPYWTLHRRAWAEAVRVLRGGGLFLLNTSDFVRDGAIVSVTTPHVQILTSLGMSEVTRYRIATPRMRHGANSAARVDGEDLVVLQKGKI